jgi:hypothetical protein
MPLPTPADLHARVTEIIATTANCTVSWAQHPHPLTLSELLTMKERLVEYFTAVVASDQGEKNR